ncbi:MBL fold metallo-hydrolase [Alteribacter aurantiacus]|uniref:MBL fold metallo-hydrolase n=1 Tax=Alteribacter aurantiacus TaxID=254410 RepID=UPI00040D440E|nr:MBL fold metallo-hydrolase [Alteribacter aurantiacus]
MLVKTKEVAPSVYAITIPTPFLVGPVNVYVIEGEALTLVDTGVKTDEAKKVLAYELGELGYSFSDIELVVLTHHHPDHIGLVEEFGHATIAAHPKTEPWLKGDPLFVEEKNAFFRKLYIAHGVEANIVDLIEKTNSFYMKYSSTMDVEVYLREGNYIDGLPGWTVIETPGHAQSQISLYRESDGILISGDHLIAHISSNAIIEAPYGDETERPKTLLQYRDSLRKCLHVKRAFSGHGEPVDNPKKLIEERLQKQVEKAKGIKYLLGEERLTSFEICKRLYPQMYTKQPGLTLSETLGHLDLLEEMGQVTAVKEGNVYIYSAVE